MDGPLDWLRKCYCSLTFTGENRPSPFNLKPKSNMKKTTKKVAAPAPVAPVAAAKPAAKPAAKAPVAKAPAVKAAAPGKKPAAAKAAAPAKKAPAVVSEPPATFITAKIDIGFGNQLFIRGTGPGLSWDQGVVMDCVGAGLWTIAVKNATTPVSFKVLVNDLSWSVGDDFTAEPGQSITVSPLF